MSFARLSRGLVEEGGGPEVGWVVDSFDVQLEEAELLVELEPTELEVEVE